MNHALQGIHHLRHRRRGLHRFSRRPSLVARHACARVVNLDKLTYAANLESLPDAEGNPHYAFEKQCICEGQSLRKLFEKYQPDAVINLAAESHVDRSIDGPGEFIQTNIVGTFTLLQGALRYWRTLSHDTRASFRFLHISTDEVFGTLGREGQFSEDTAYAPNSDSSLRSRSVSILAAIPVYSARGED